MNIKFIVQTNPDNNMVVLTAETAVAGDSEDRSYFLQPADSVEVANAILHAAELCGIEVMVKTQPHITDMQRLALISRVCHIMRTLSKMPPKVVAMNIVDSLLAEIL